MNDVFSGDNSVIYLLLQVKKKDFFDLYHAINIKIVKVVHGVHLRHQKTTIFQDVLT